MDDERPATGGAASGPTGATRRDLLPVAQVVGSAAGSREFAIATGAAIVAGQTVVGGLRLARSGVRLALRTPVIGPFGRRVIDRLAAEGERAVVTVAPELTDRVLRVVVAVITIVIAELDITRLVREQVDLNAIATDLDVDAVLARIDLDEVILDQVDINTIIREGVDLNAVARLLDLDAIAKQIDVDGIVARVDIDAILGRVDLVSIAEDVIDGVDLTEIIRDASTSVTADVMTDVRSTGERADDAVARAIGRLLRRKESGETDG
ncbi:hypothetical protein [Gordonia soli]|uniref:hypothetical protein n=1 Tax=Gordonia soli TaxID=320799 RepID=UPI00034886CE|nr:hypothetical protein [Gordonia soli]